LRRIGLLVLVTLGATSPGASAATVDVTASNYKFSPSSVTITQGDTVTWSNPNAGYHNVHFDDGSFQMPMNPSPTMWIVSQTFSTPGTFTYVCDEHKAIGMTGSVVVNAASSGGGGGGGTPPPNLGPIANLPPSVSSLGGPAKQHVGRLFVRASMNEAGTLAASGTVSVLGGAAKVYRFKQSRRVVAANQLVKLRLKLSKHALQAVRRALRRHRLRARVTLTATDTTGKTTIRKLTVRLAP
jgi:plastocyanin